MIKILKKSSNDKVLGEMLRLIEVTQFRLKGLNDDLENEFGRSLLNKKIRKSKTDDNCYLTLRDQFGFILNDLISTGLTIVKNFSIDEDEFRERLDKLLNNPEIYDGEYNHGFGSAPNEESKKIDTALKYWWRNNKQ